MSTAAAGAHAHDDAHGHAEGGVGEFISTYVFSRDHKIIGLQFLFSTLLWFLVGGLLALGIRWQLAWPWTGMPVIGSMLFSGNGGQISPEFYTTLFTMHATVMIFFVIIPILAGAFGNYLIPLMVGADDMAFPTLNMMSYWFMWPAFICIGSSFFAPGNGAGGGWTSYPPLSAVPEAAPGSLQAQTLWLLGITCVGVSSMMGSVNYMTTIIQMRAPGMTMFRLPMTIWGHVYYGAAASLCVARPDRSRVHAVAGPPGWDWFFFFPRASSSITRYRPLVAGSRCCGSICSGFIRIRPCTS